MTLQGLQHASQEMMVQWKQLSHAPNFGTNPDVHKMDEIVRSIYRALSEVEDFGHQLGKRLAEVDTATRSDILRLNANNEMERSIRESQSNALLHSLSVVTEQNKILMEYFTELEEKVAMLSQEGVAK